MFDRKDFINWSQMAQNSNVSGQDYHNSLRTQLMNQRQDRTRQIVEEKMYGKLNAPERKSSRNRTIRNQITEGIKKDISHDLRRVGSAARAVTKIPGKFARSPITRSIGAGALGYGISKAIASPLKLVKPSHVTQSQKQYGGEEPESFGKSAREAIPRVPLGSVGVGLAAAAATAIKSARDERNHDHHPENVANHPHREVHDEPAASSNVPDRSRNRSRNRLRGRRG